MESIKNLTNIFNLQFTKFYSKLLLTLTVFIFLVGGSYIGFAILSVLLTSFVSVKLNVLISFFFMLLAYSFMFFYFYGVIVLVTRLVRGEKSRLGYLFVGFRPNKIKSAVVIFTILFLICVGASSIPIFLNLDFSAENPFAKLLEEASKNSFDFIKLSYLTLVIFLATFVILFLPFTFTWNFLYDDFNCSGFLALKKSCKIVLKNLFHFIAFEFFIIRKQLGIFVLAIIAQIIILFSNQNNTMLALESVVNFVRFICVIIIFSKLTMSIPFYYEALKNSKLNNNESESNSELVEIQQEK